MKNLFCYWLTCLTLVALLFSNALAAQPSLTFDKEEHTINFDGNDLVQEFRLPPTLTSGLIYLEAVGGDGGRKKDPNTGNTGKGGQGAVMGAWFEVGNGSNQIPPGSEILFIIGEHGQNIKNSWAEAAGGGGGTGIFYKRPDNQYALLAVAGGGAGGYADCCLVRSHGEPGAVIQCPVFYQDSPCTFYEVDNCRIGGGALFDAGDLVIKDDFDNLNPCSTDGGGKKGWPGATSLYVNPVKPTGGQGGAGVRSGGSFINSKGGFGFGGGAGGVGFAGQTGAGGGFTPGYGLLIRPNGGGSYINEVLSYSVFELTKIQRGNTSDPSHGHVKYRVVPAKPVAVCNNVTAYLDQTGNVSVAASSLGVGSYDPNGLELDFQVYVQSELSNQPSIDFDCSQIGLPYTALLKVFNVLNGTQASLSLCLSTITVKAKPIISCKNATVQLNSNGLAPLAAASINNGSYAICGESIVSYALSSNTFSCSDIGPNTLTLTATDNNGDSNSCTATVTVVEPNAVAVRCRNISVDLGLDASLTLNPSDIDNGTGNICGALTYANYPQGYSVSPQNFNCSHVNSTQNVTLTFTAPNGSTGTCTSQVTIEQDLSEAAKCKDITVTLDASGEVRLRPRRGQNIDNDTPLFGICEAVSIFELSQEVFTCANIGPNPVTLTLRKSNGDFVDNCTAIVTVKDQAGPIAQCQPLTVHVPYEGLQTATVWATDVDAGSSDLCGDIVSRWLWDPGLQVADDVQYTLTIKFDIAPDETSWTVTSGGNVYASSGGPYSGINNQKTITETFSLSSGRYEFNFYDKYGDGLSWGDPGYFRLEDENGNIIVEGGATDWDYQKSKNFYVAGGFFTDRVYYRCDDIGTRQLVLYQKDNYGNGSICETTVTVEQDLSEAAKCRDLIVTLDQSGQNSLRFWPGDGSILYSCLGIHEVVLTPDQEFYDFNCADIGPNPVILSLQKNGEIIDECTSILTVRDQAGPIAQCQAVTVQLPESGPATLMAVDLDAGSYDGCSDISSMQLWDPGKGSFADKQFTLTIQFDYFPSDNSWTVTSGGNTIVSSGGSYTSAVEGKTITETFSLPPGCYEFNFYDSYGDGFSPAFGSGFYRLQDENDKVLLQAGEDDWDYYQAVNFCVEKGAFSDNLTFDCTDIGTRPVIFLVRDSYGNGAICETTVTVEDKLAPVIYECPEDITISTDEGECGTMVSNLPAPTFSDNCPISLNYFLGGSPIGLFSTYFQEGEGILDEVYIYTGSAEITYTAEDAGGNITECTYTVYVEDKEKPGLICPSSLTVSTSTTDCSPEVSWLNASVTDNCPIKVFGTPLPLSYELSGATTSDRMSVFDHSGTTKASANLSPGTTTVSYSLTDWNGVEGTCSFDITVIDDVPPILSNSLHFVACLDENEGDIYEVGWEVSDNCDQSPELLSVIALPEMDNPQVVFKRKNKKKLKFQFNKNKIEVNAPGGSGAEDWWSLIQQQGGVAVSLGQQIDLAGVANEATINFNFSQSGELHTVSAASMTLISSAKDFSDNMTTATHSAERLCYETGQARISNAEGPGTKYSHSTMRVGVKENLRIFPNPFSTVATIQFSLPETQNVNMRIFDLKGQLVRQLMDGVLDAGEYQEQWDGTNAGGIMLPSGLYLIQLRIGKEVQNKRILLQQ